MFLFVNFAGNRRSASQDKGRLFEKLIGEVLNGLGFQDVELRKTSSGKEYDLQARTKLDRRILIGQAKAWDRQVGASEIAEFVGSLMVQDIPEDALGLFVSLTGFSPQGEEYRDKLRPNVKKRIVTIVGEEILDNLTQVGYVPTKEIKRLASNIFHMKAGDTYFLVSDRGNFFVQLLVRPQETRPKAFCVLSKEGTLITEEEFGLTLQERVEELRELKFLRKADTFHTTLDDLPGPIGPGPEGASWFEYKLPAPPEFFVGRHQQIEHFKRFVEEFKRDITNLPIYQVLSPSGVGKSSFLLKLQSVLGDSICSTLQDARNFRGKVDLLNLLQEFLENCYQSLKLPSEIASTTTEVIEQIIAVDKVLVEKDMLGVIFVDQFESLFRIPELYIYFLDLVVRVSYNTTRILFCVARRNDQPTTFDDRSEIDLPRLISMSKSIELKDFSRDEALDLLSHLAEEIGQSLKPGLINLALEFAASGFPWLCKRVGAHIRDAIVKRNMTQEELIQYGIKPDDLFEEDLAELDVMDREFLKDLANYLPATLDELSEKYQGEMLAVKLKLFQDLRLVRLIGRTYDTYNDVFKEYLKTGEIPLPTKYVFRSPASTCMRELQVILEKNCETIHDLEHLSSLTTGAVQNVLRELRMLGIVETARGRLTVDEEVIEAHGNNTLDALFAERILKRNGLVPEVLNRIATQERITLSQLQDYLQEGLPVIEVAPSTWKAYARTFAGWLRFAGLIRPGAIVNESGKAIGATRMALAKSEVFLPSVYISQLVNTLLITLGKQDKLRKDKIDPVVAHDAHRVGLIDIDHSGSFWYLTSKGEKFVGDSSSRTGIIAEFLLNLPYVQDYLHAIEAFPKKHLDVLKRVLGNMAFTEETWSWRSKILANWLEFANLVQRKRGKVIASRQISIFEGSPRHDT